MKDHEFVSQHGSVAEEVAALIEAIRGAREKEEASTCTCDCGHSAVDACRICPICRAIGALHAISPTAVTALADLAHQAEVTLRALAADLHQHRSEPQAPAREDIPVTDLDED